LLEEYVKAHAGNGKTSSSHNPEREFWKVRRAALAHANTVSGGTGIFLLGECLVLVFQRSALVWPNLPGCDNSMPSKGAVNYLHHWAFLEESRHPILGALK
jgi:hypothetical protein